jgi:Raf kinase inhibitor-like YbhB/YbcL family protein
MKRNAHLVFMLAVIFATWLLPGNQSLAGSPVAFTLSSTAFGAGAEIPAQYSCKGGDISPALAWSGAPPHTASFALIMEDPDSPGGTFVHWVMWNLPPTAHSLPQGEPKEGELNGGARQGRNDFRKVGYNGPCPPAGAPHHYYIHLYALDARLDLGAAAERRQLDAAIAGHVLAQAEYMGTFRR